jgi:hypothetical protein
MCPDSDYEMSDEIRQGEVTCSQWCCCEALEKLSRLPHETDDFEISRQTNAGAFPSWLSISPIFMIVLLEKQAKSREEKAARELFPVETLLTP